MNETLIIILLIVVFVLATAFGYIVKEHAIKLRAIEMDYGFYHPKTAEFKWYDLNLPYITGMGEDKNED